MKYQALFSGKNYSFHPPGPDKRSIQKISFMLFLRQNGVLIFNGNCHREVIPLSADKMFWCKNSKNCPELSP